MGTEDWSRDRLLEEMRRSGVEGSASGFPGATRVRLELSDHADSPVYHSQYFIEGELVAWSPDERPGPWALVLPAPTPLYLSALGLPVSVLMDPAQIGIRVGGRRFRLPPFDEVALGAWGGVPPRHAGRTVSRTFALDTFVLGSPVGDFSFRLEFESSKLVAVSDTAPEPSCESVAVELDWSGRVLCPRVGTHHLAWLDSGRLIRASSVEALRVLEAAVVGAIHALRPPAPLGSPIPGPLWRVSLGRWYCPKT